MKSAMAPNVAFVLAISTNIRKATSSSATRSKNTPSHFEPARLPALLGGAATIPAQRVHPTQIFMSNRLDRVNELLRREISAVVQRDYEWHGRLVTVSDVEVTQDMKEAKVWVGVLGGDSSWVLDRLNHDHGAIQKKVMKRVVLKSTPVLAFRMDSSAERGVEVVNLLDEVDKLPKAPVEE